MVDIESRFDSNETWLDELNLDPNPIQGSYLVQRDIQWKSSILQNYIQYLKRPFDKTIPFETKRVLDPSLLLCYGTHSILDNFRRQVVALKEVVVVVVVVEKEWKSKVRVQND